MKRVYKTGIIAVEMTPACILIPIAGKGKIGNIIIVQIKVQFCISYQSIRINIVVINLTMALKAVCHEGRHGNA